MNPIFFSKRLVRFRTGMTKGQGLFLLLGGAAIFLGVGLICRFSGLPTVTTPTSEIGNPGADAAHSYPLEICVVSGRKLGSMGPVYATNNDGIIVRFCCHRCLPEFANNTEKYLNLVRNTEKYLNLVRNESATVTPQPSKDQFGEAN